MFFFPDQISLINCLVAFDKIKIKLMGVCLQK
jgi:hypothetical protein